MTDDQLRAFRQQAAAALRGFVAITTYLLHQVASRTEVRTDGDRTLVVVCTVAAIVTGSLLLVLVVRDALRWRRQRAEGRAPVEGSVDDVEARGAATTR